MSIRSRHRFVIDRLMCSLAFASVEDVEAAITEDQCFTALSRFFSKEGSNALYFYQNSHAAGSDEAKSSDAQLSVLESLATSGLRDIHDGFKKLAIFIRSAAARGKDLDLNVYDDGWISFMVLKDPVVAYKSIVDGACKDLLSSSDTKGFATQVHAEEFSQSVSMISRQIDEGNKSMDGRPRLKRLDRRILDASEDDICSSAIETKAVLETFESWISSLVSYISDCRDRSKWDNPDSDILSEIEYWKSRNQRLKGLSDEINNLSVKKAISVMNYGLLPSTAVDNQVKQKISILMLQWHKNVESVSADTIDETQDTLMCLHPLEKLSEQLIQAQEQKEVASIVGSVPQIIDNIMSFSRYFVTSQNISRIFTKLTNQLIGICNNFLINEKVGANIWEQDIDSILSRMDGCVLLNETYQLGYRQWKEKIVSTPKGRLLDLTDGVMFGKFDLFCRRLLKLMDMFSMIAQMNQLKRNHFEGLESAVVQFEQDVTEFRAKGHKLLDFTTNRFDRDYVDFSNKIKDYEERIQGFADKSFLRASTIETSLEMLERLKAIIYRDSIRKTMNGKLMLVMKNFGIEIEKLSSIYERQKDHPPVPRNFPIAAGSIMWSRYLLNRIEKPMNKFQSMCHDEPTDEGDGKSSQESQPKPAQKWITRRMLFSSLESKKIVNSYNKLARTLLAFEFLWFDAWRRSVEKAKSGLQATLLVANPENGKIYVNFDPNIAQMIHEATWMSRFGHKLPEAVKLIALQRQSFKTHYNELLQVITDYDTATSRIIGVTAKLLVPHLQTLKYVMEPGLLTITWTSMNIASFISTLSNAIRSFEDMIKAVNDILENRVQANLKTVARTVILNLPTDRSVSLDEFVMMQESNVETFSNFLALKSNDTECAIEDIVSIITTFPADPRVPIAYEAPQKEFFDGYHSLIYQAVLNCVKSALLLLKKRVCGRAASSFFSLQRPFFEVDIQLSVPSVKLSPGLDDVQRAINHSAVAILGCSKKIYKWGQRGLPETRRRNFFDTLGKDLEIIKTVLLLTGAILGTRKIIYKYLDSFKEFDWLWRDDKDSALVKLSQGKDGKPAQEPTVGEYEQELRKFVTVEASVDAIMSFYSVGAIVMNSSSLKSQLKSECRQWKLHVSSRIHEKSRSKMSDFIQYMKRSMIKLNTAGIDSIDSLASVMKTMKEIREKDSCAEEEEFSPILDVYAMLERYIPASLLYPLKEEVDQKLSLRTEWKLVTDYVEISAENLSLIQGKFKRQLIGELKEYAVESKKFREEYESISSRWKADSLQSITESIADTKKRCLLHLNKKSSLRLGEQLFNLQGSGLGEMTDVERCLQDSHQVECLVGVCNDCNTTLNELEDVLWQDVVTIGNIEKPLGDFNSLMERLRSVSGKACLLPVFCDCQEKLNRLLSVFPLLEIMCHKGMKKRHFEELSSIIGVPILYNGSDADIMKKGSDGSGASNLKIGNLISDFVAKAMLNNVDSVKEVSNKARKEMQIESTLLNLQEVWKGTVLRVSVSQEKVESKDSEKLPSLYLLENSQKLLDMMEEALMTLQTMIGSSYVTPFRVEVEKLYETLSNTSETLESWSKVQKLFVSVKNVFAPSASPPRDSDQPQISKQLPSEYRKFAKLGKEWERIMIRTTQTKTAVLCCQNEDLVATLPMMSTELDRCQRSLHGYLEQKRAFYPRLYLMSDDMLLDVMCREIDSLVASKEVWTTIFDGTNNLQLTIHENGCKYVSALVEIEADDTETIVLANPVKISGNLETWLKLLEESMKESISKEIDPLASNWSIDSFSEVTLSTHCAQSIFVAQSAFWTRNFEVGLAQQRTNKRAVAEYHDNLKAFLNQLCRQYKCAGSLNRNSRIKFECLLQLVFYHVSVIADIIGQYNDKKTKQNFSKTASASAPPLHLPSSATFFAWYSRPRTYWSSSTSEESGTAKSLPRCSISFCDVQLAYQFEHLSCCQRLVLTPSSERCLVAMARSLTSNSLGCHLFGEASIGKSSVVKELGSLIGAKVVASTFFTSNALADVLRVLTAIVKAGLIGCINGMQNLSPSVFSVASSHLTNLLNHRTREVESKSNTAKGAATFFGLFCLSDTSQQAMACLSGKLGHILRPCYVDQADEVIVIKSKLMCLGFEDYDETGAKLDNMLKAFRQRFPATYESWQSASRKLLARLSERTGSADSTPGSNSKIELVCREIFLPMHTSSERNTFLSILQEHFPRAEADEKLRQTELFQDMTVSTNQVLRSMLVTDFLLIYGPTCSGKTFDIKQAVDALKPNGVSFKQVFVNPDSLSLQDLFGYFDDNAKAWKQGIVPGLLDKAKAQTRDSLCITFDGSICTSWTDSLATIMCDRQTPLAISCNNPCNSSLKLVFETESLENASPSFLSKVLVLSRSASDISWSSLLQVVLSRNLVNLKYHADIMTIFSRYMGLSKTSNADVMSIFNSCKGKYNRHSFVTILKNCISFFNCCLEKMIVLRLDPAPDQMNEALIMVERSIVYSTIWGVAGFMDPSEWSKIEFFVRDIVQKSEVVTPKEDIVNHAQLRLESKEEAKPSKLSQVATDNAKKGKSPAKKSSAVAPGKDTTDNHEKQVQKPTATRADLILPPGLAEIPAPEQDDVSRSSISTASSSKKPHDEKEKSSEKTRGSKQAPPIVETAVIDTARKASSKTIFDFALNMDSFSWEPWKVSPVSFSKPLLRLGSLIIPTMDLCRNQSLAMMLIASGVSLTITARNGSGKTVFLQSLSETITQEERLLKCFTKIYSRVPSTTSNDLQSWLDKDMQRKGGKNFGPPTGYDKTVYFIDDLNSCECSGLKEGSVDHFLKQIIENKTIWNFEQDKRGEVKHLDGIQLVTTESSTKTPSSSRLLSHFGRLWLSELSSESLTSMFSSVVKEMPIVGISNIGQLMFRRIPAVSVDLYMWYRKKFKLSSNTPFVSDIHSLFSAIYNLLAVSSELLQDEYSIAQIWRHEIERSFRDVLSVANQDIFESRLNLALVALSSNPETDDEKDLFLQKSPDTAQKPGTNSTTAKASKTAPRPSQSKVTRQSTKIVENTARLIDLDRLKDRIRMTNGIVTQESSTDYCVVTRLPSDVSSMMRQKSSQLSKLSGTNVNIRDCSSESVINITRSICQGGKITIVYGKHGLGKKTLSEFSSLLLGLKPLIVGDTSSLLSIDGDCYEQLKSECYQCLSPGSARLSAGSNDSVSQFSKGICVIVKDQAVRDSCLIKALHDIVLYGDCSLLFDKDEMARIEMEVSKDLAGTSSKAKTCQFMSKKIRENFRVIFCLTSPQACEFVARSYPNVAKCCNVIQMNGWPTELYKDMMTDIVEKISSGMKSEVFKSPNLDQISALLVDIHVNMLSCAEDYGNMTQEPVQFSIGDFRIFTHDFISILCSQFQRISERSNMLSCCLGKLGKMEEDIEKLKRALAIDEDKHRSVEASTMSMFERLETASLDANQSSQEYLALQAEFKHNEERINHDREVIDRELSTSLPCIEEAERALGSVRQADLNDLKKMAKPADVAKLVIDCIAILRLEKLNRTSETQEISMGVGKERKTFVFVKDSYKLLSASPSGMLSDPRFLQNLALFCRNDKNMINGETLEFLEPYLMLDGMTASIARNCSRAVEGLLLWVKSLCAYCEESKLVRPMIDEMKIRESNHQNLTQKFSKLEGKMQESQSSLNRLQSAFDQEIGKKRSIEDSVISIKRKITRSVSLLQDIQADKEKWNKELEDTPVKMKSLVGNSVISSVYLNYICSFRNDYRQYVLSQKVLAEFQKLNMTSSGPDACREFINQETAWQWSSEGLVSDYDCDMLNNGFCASWKRIDVFNSRTKLIVDPSGLAFAWMKNHFKGSVCVDVRDPSRNSILSAAMTNGDVVLMTLQFEMQTELDPTASFRDIIDNRVYVKQNGEYSVVGTSSPDMELYSAIDGAFIPYNPAFDVILIVSSASLISHFDSSRFRTIQFLASDVCIENIILDNLAFSDTPTMSDQLDRLKSEEMSGKCETASAIESFLRKLQSCNEGSITDNDTLLSDLVEIKKKLSESREKLSTAIELKNDVLSKRSMYCNISRRLLVLFNTINSMQKSNQLYSLTFQDMLEIIKSGVRQSEKTGILTRKLCNIMDATTFYACQCACSRFSPADKVGFLLSLTIRILVSENVVPLSLLSYFESKNLSSNASLIKPEWICSASWNALEKLQRDLSKYLRGLTESLSLNETAWKEWIYSDVPEDTKIPYFEDAMGESLPLRWIFRLMIVQCLRPDRLIHAALRMFEDCSSLQVSDSAAHDGNKVSVPTYPLLGKKYQELVFREWYQDLQGCVFRPQSSNNKEESTNAILLISHSTVSVPGSSFQICYSAKKAGIFSDVNVLSASLKRAEIMDAAKLASSNGSCLTIVDAHLSSSEQMYELVHYETATRQQSAKVERNNSKSASNLPDSFKLLILGDGSCQQLNESTKNCHKAFIQPVNDLMSNMKSRIMAYFSVEQGNDRIDQERLGRVDSPFWKSTVAKLIILLSFIAERNSMTEPTKYSHSNCLPFHTDLMQLLEYAEKELESQKIPQWDTIRACIQNIYLFKHCFDVRERRLLENCLLALFPDNCEVEKSLEMDVLLSDFLQKMSCLPLDFVQSFNFTSSSNSKFESKKSRRTAKNAHNSFEELFESLDYIQREPSLDNLFVHPKDLLQHSLLKCSLVSRSLSCSQPSTALHSLGTEEIIALLTKIPIPIFHCAGSDCYENTIKFSHEPTSSVATFMIEEIERFTIAIVSIRQKCEEIMNILPESICDKDVDWRLIETQRALQEGQVPADWNKGDLKHSSAGRLLEYVNNICSRNSHYLAWAKASLVEGEKQASMFCYWLPGLYNPSALLQSMCYQEMRTRRSKSSASYDSLALHFEMTAIASSAIDYSSPVSSLLKNYHCFPAACMIREYNGIFVQGIKLDNGACWSRDDCGLSEVERSTVISRGVEESSCNYLPVCFACVVDPNSVNSMRQRYVSQQMSKWLSLNTSASSTASTVGQAGSQTTIGDPLLYECPIFDQRIDSSTPIFSINIPTTPDKPAQYWKTRSMFGSIN